MNSRPLVTVGDDDHGIEVLTPGHFLIGQPQMTLPDSALSCQSLYSMSLELSQTVTRHFWMRWSLDYLTTLQKNYK